MMNLPLLLLAMSLFCCQAADARFATDGNSFSYRTIDRFCGNARQIRRAKCDAHCVNKLGYTNGVCDTLGNYLFPGDIKDDILENAELIEKKLYCVCRIPAHRRVATIGHYCKYCGWGHIAQILVTSSHIIAVSDVYTRFLLPEGRYVGLQNRVKGLLPKFTLFSELRNNTSAKGGHVWMVSQELKLYGLTFKLATFNLASGEPIARAYLDGIEISNELPKTFLKNGHWVNIVALDGRALVLKSDMGLHVTAQSTSLSVECPSGTADFATVFGAWGRMQMDGDVTNNYQLPNGTVVTFSKYGSQGTFNDYMKAWKRGK